MPDEPRVSQDNPTKTEDIEEAPPPRSFYNLDPYSGDQRDAQKDLIDTIKPDEGSQIHGKSKLQAQLGVISANALH